MKHNTYVSRTFAVVGLLLLGSLPGGESNLVASPAVSQLKVSENKRFLVCEDGRPFFYLGDTAWELFHCLTREEADLYLRTRAEQKFTVIQAVVLAEFDGLRLPNAYGHVPLRNDDPTQPVEEYFQHVDWVTRRANELGLWIGMLPTWGDKWNKRWGKGPEMFTPQNARAYGEWLARRYRDAKIIWILGGDRVIETDAQREIIRAMAAGLRVGDGGAHLITYHPSGGKHSADMVHDEPWLDFNMIQSGHGEKNIASYDKLTLDYTRAPAKPCMDAEPCYENHPVRRKKEQGWFDEWDARKLCYWALFAGAHGHTYGCHDIWSFHDPAKNRRFVDQRTPWQEAIHLPGASQMRHARALMESRPFLTRIPDQSVIVGDSLTGAEHLQATRNSAGSYAMVYSPSGRPFKVRLDKISGSKVKTWWFNPRNGEATAAGEFANTGEREFTPPTTGEDNDWVLVLDDASRNLPPPGRVEGGVSSVRQEAGPAGHKIINVGTRPESVTRGFGGHYYVTVMGDQQPGDAVIKVVKGDQVEVFATGMDEPKGIAFVGGFLVTTDLKQVWKIDAQGNKTVLAEEKDFPQPISYLNDTAAAPDGKSVFVTDMGARDKINGPDGLWPLDSPEAKALPHIGRIFHITLGGRVRLAVDAAPEMACPNGVCAPARDSLLIAEFFHGNLLRARNGKLELLNTGFRGADGIERAKNCEIFVSSWVQGKVWQLDRHGQNPTVLIEGLQSAADFYLDEPARLLLVPDMKAGTVVYVPLK